MNVYLFLDESGDHGMKNIDPNFPLLVLCGVLISEGNYVKLKKQVNQLKMDLWETEDVVFHSRDIRKKDGPFFLFTNKQKWVYFLSEFNRIVTESTFRIISAVIQKQEYKDRIGQPLVGVYGHAFTFLVERCVFCLDEIAPKHEPQLKIIAESRGKDVDSVISKYMDTIKADPRGTGFVPSRRINKYGCSLNFMSKSKNTIGLQMADLMAHPIAKFVLDGYAVNQPYSVLEPRMYKSRDNNIKGFGLKVFPE